MSDAPFTTKEILLQMQNLLSEMNDRLVRMEYKQDEQGQVNAQFVTDIAEVKADARSNARTMNLVWAVISALVLGVIGVGFFFVQNSLKLLLGRVI